MDLLDDGVLFFATILVFLDGNEKPKELYMNIKGEKGRRKSAGLYASKKRGVFPPIINYLSFRSIILWSVYFLLYPLCSLYLFIAFSGILH